MEIHRSRFSFCHDINGSGACAGPVNDGRAADAVFRIDVGAIDVGALLRRSEIHVPDLRKCVRIVRIDAVVLGGDDDQVVSTLAWDLILRNEQRLSENVTIHRQRADLTEVGGFDVGGRQFCFQRIPARSLVVDMENGDVRNPRDGRTRRR